MGRVIGKGTEGMVVQGHLAGATLRNGGIEGPFRRFAHRPGDP